MSVLDKDGVIVLGSDTLNPQNNITIKTPAVADGSLEIYKGVPGALGDKLFGFDAADTDFNSKLAAAFGGANQWLTSQGYQKLPGGLIIQWAFISVATNTSALLNFPIAFPTVGLVIVGSRRADGSNAAYNFSIDSETQLLAQNTAGGVETGHYIAIGY